MWSIQSLSSFGFLTSVISLSIHSRKSFKHCVCVLLQNYFFALCLKSFENLPMLFLIFIQLYLFLISTMGSYLWLGLFACSLLTHMFLFDTLLTNKPNSNSSKHPLLSPSSPAASCLSFWKFISSRKWTISLFL